MTVYQQITNKKSEGNKQFAVLIDPDKSSIEKIEKLCMLATDSGVDYILLEEAFSQMAIFQIVFVVSNMLVIYR